MLEELLLNDNYIPECIYNKKGHVIKLSIGIKGDIPDSVKFPYLKELSGSYNSDKSIEFVHRHHMSVKILRFVGKGLIKIPDLSDFRLLKLLELTNNKICTINKFGDLLNLKTIELIKNELKSIERFKEITGCRNIERIYLDHNQISDVCGLEPFFRFEKLQHLTLAYNNLQELNVECELKNLSVLELHNNPIKRVSGLEKLPNITFIGSFDLNRLSKESIEYLYQYIEKQKLSYTIKNNKLRIEKAENNKKNKNDIWKHYKIDPILAKGLK
jgi:hypothetical protein